MPNLKEVRNRIDSVQSTKQITNAMKMVAASKLRRAQNAILKLRPYAARLNEIIRNVSETLETATDNPFGPREESPQSALVIAISSNKGLCGTFNTNVIKSVQALMKGSLKPYLETGNLEIICIGRKVHNFLIRRGFPVIGEYHEIFSDLSFTNVEPLASMILEGYSSMRWDKVVIVYNQFRNAGVQYVVEEDFLPVVNGTAAEDSVKWDVEYLYEPPRDIMLKELIPQALKIQFFKTLLDSFASEHGARMTAMHKATDNATEMLKDLRLSYNKARQASITREIIEIVSGAEALKG